MRGENNFPSLSLDRRGRAIVERLGGDWRANGGMCRCPCHEDRTPSLSVRPGARQLLFHCFAGCETIRVIRALSVLGFSQPRASGRDAGVAGALAQHEKDNYAAAARLWSESHPLAGSPAEAYLASRGLAMLAPDLRFHPRTPSGRGPEAIFRPALLAAVRDDARLVAVHRTFLDPKMPRLAELPIPKRALGTLGRGAVRLRPPKGGVLGLAEGVESAISATLLTGVPCWAALGNERFGRVELPRSVRRLILFLDNDGGGHRAEVLARKAFRDVVIEIEARFPNAPGSDWNDVLLRPRGSRAAVPPRGEEAAGR